MDETSRKIVDAAMALTRDKGYVAMTTRDIAQAAGVNECTLFRKFRNKKEIILRGMDQERWRADITPDVFSSVTGDLQTDLEMFMNAYMDRVTPDFVNLSIGLRAPQIYEDTAALIMKVPQVFLTSLIAYFKDMERKGALPALDFDCLALTLFSATFGYVFLNASFGQALVVVTREAYIKKTVALFLEGLTGQAPAGVQGAVQG